MKQGQGDQYMDPITITYPNAIVRVYRPILDEDERARRMKRIHDAAAALLKEGKRK